MTLHSLRDRALLVAPIRVFLGILWIALAIPAGAGRGPALLAAASSAFFTVFIAFNDPRARFRGEVEVKPAPPDATVAPWLEQALRATLPSTVGVSVLAAISLIAQPILAGFLGGVSVGLGAAGVLAALLQDPALYLDPGTGTVYRR
jgi:hypothetical protein